MFQQKKTRVACAIILNHKNQVLFIKRGRDPFLHHWALISGMGGFEGGSSPEQAVAREVECDIRTSLLNTKFEFVFFVPDDSRVTEIIVYSGSVHQPSIRTHPPFSLEYTWRTLENYKNLGQLAFEYTEIMKRFWSDHLP